MTGDILLFNNFQDTCLGLINSPDSNIIGSSKSEPAADGKLQEIPGFFISAN